MVEPKDLIERLRAGICGDRCRFMEARLGCECDEAAESIHSLATENAVLRDKLDTFAKALTERDEQIAALREKLAEREALIKATESAAFEKAAKVLDQAGMEWAGLREGVYFDRLAKEIRALTGGDNAEG